ncbi:hypothetical protein BDZ91DRAFT_743283 [Kalaharituber pfeilii]|nr:hypothetical protein BDZ91DRAFT_743283 [Kalaharituber pfeilii]
MHGAQAGGETLSSIPPSAIANVVCFVSAYMMHMFRSRPTTHSSASGYGCADLHPLFTHRGTGVKTGECQQSNSRFKLETTFPKQIKYMLNKYSIQLAPNLTFPIS